MVRRKPASEQAINKLRQAEVAISEGSTVADTSRKFRVTVRTFYAGGWITGAEAPPDTKAQASRRRKTLGCGKRWSGTRRTTRSLQRREEHSCEPFRSPPLHRAR